MGSLKLYGVIAVAFLIFSACENDSKLGNNSNSVIPEHFVDVSDGKFTKNQDTIFYSGHLFSGYLVSINEHKDTLLKIGYLNGLLNGWTKKWYPNGRVMELRLYGDGKKEGIHRGWWENGEPKFSYHFLNDEFEGEITEWFVSGHLFRSFHYKNGHESGSQKMYWDNGTIRANYYIVNGEKFGLAGQKLCIIKNLTKDIK